jgi:hypothetical protein
MDNENNGCGCVLSVIGIFFIIGIISAIDWNSVINGIIHIFSLILGVVIIIAGLFFVVKFLIYIFTYIFEYAPQIPSDIQETVTNIQETVTNIQEKRKKDKKLKEDKKPKANIIELANEKSKNQIEKESSSSSFLSKFKNAKKVTVRETTIIKEVEIELDKSSS